MLNRLHHFNYQPTVSPQMLATALKSIQHVETTWMVEFFKTRIQNWESFVETLERDKIVKQKNNIVGKNYYDKQIEAKGLKDIVKELESLCAELKKFTPRLIVNKSQLFLVASMI